MGGVVGLEDHFPLLPASSGPAGALGDEVECLLRCQVGGYVQDAVGGKDAHGLDAGDVVALGHHLGAEEDIEFPFPKIVEDFPGTVFPSGAVQVEPADSGLWQQPFQFFFHPFRAGAEVQDPMAVAFRAFRGYGMHGFAVVALQLVGLLMVHQGHVAVGAFEHIAAGGAHEGGGKAPAVQEQDGFLPSGNRLLEQGNQGP